MPRGRKKGDGRGRMGGREAGTPNKNVPLKQVLSDHSMTYFLPSVAAEDVDIAFKDGEQRAAFMAANKDRVFSRFELDLMGMKATDRAKLEADILSFHTPKMQAISADVGVKVKNMTLCERLERIARGEEISPDE